MSFIEILTIISLVLWILLAGGVILTLASLVPDIRRFMRSAGRVEAMMKNVEERSRPILGQLEQAADSANYIATAVRSATERVSEAATSSGVARSALRVRSRIGSKARSRRRSAWRSMMVTASPKLIAAMPSWDCAGPGTRPSRAAIWLRACRFATAAVRAARSALSDRCRSSWRSRRS